MDRKKLWLNSRLIQSLNNHLDEDQISKSIDQLSSQVKKIESVSGPSLRTLKLRSEIKKLENNLAYCKDKISLQMGKFRDKD